MPHEKDTKLLRREALIPGLLVLLALAVLIYSLTGLTSASTQQAPPEEPQTYTAKTTGTTGQGDVEITLEPQGIQNGALVFDLSANTHSVTLSEYDLSQAAILTADGNEYSPSSVPRMAGHHVNGQLAFALAEQPEQFTVTISGVPAVQERTYTWSKQ